MTGITVITTAPAGFFFCLQNRRKSRYPSNALLRHRGELQDIVAWVQRKTMYRGYPQIKSWKNFTTAEGGASTWRPIDGVDNAEIYHTYQLLYLHGQSKDAFAIIPRKLSAIIEQSMIPYIAKTKMCLPPSFTFRENNKIARNAVTVETAKVILTAR